MRAQNLELFTQLADGVDRRPTMVQTTIKDNAPAAEAADVEARADLIP